MRLHTLAFLGAGALLAFIAWPLLGVGDRSGASARAVAPVAADYRYRDKTITFYEGRVRRDAADQISARFLANQYMQRFRESGDIGDVRRAIAQARRAIRLQ